MSLLPQRKKSAEEIARLRETLGVPAPAGGDDETAVDSSFETIIPSRHEAIVVPPPAAAEPGNPPPPAAAPAPKVVHSLKRSERTPEPPAAEPTPPVPEPAPHLPKPVRSLRKSQQITTILPAPVPPQADSKLPFHRHSDEELAEIRRREVLAMMHPPPPNPKLAAAHLILLIPGYLLALAGASWLAFDDFPPAATAGCAVGALLVSGFIFRRRPLSRHHAAFIAVIALFVIVFGTLHYFPHLRHAT